MKRAKARRKRGTRTRPPLVRISEEMKQWSALLGGEVERWPGVRTKPMFGLVTYYRRRKIFAALPRTRALHSAHSILFKLRGAGPRLLAELGRDSRARVSEKGRAGWQSFEITSTADLAAALAWLDRAWRAAR